MQKTRQNHTDWVVALVSMLAVLATSLAFVDYTPRTPDHSLVDLTPPDEFIVKASDRDPAAQAAPDPNELLRTRAYADLDDRERRSIFRSVIYLCNEADDAYGCRRFVRYCGKTCELLVMNKARLAGSF